MSSSERRELPERQGVGVTTETLRVAQRLYRAWKNIILETDHPSCRSGMQEQKRKLILSSWSDLDDENQLFWLRTAEDLIPQHTTTTEFCVCGEPSPCEYVMAKAWMDKQPRVKGIA